MSPSPDTEGDTKGAMPAASRREAWFIALAGMLALAVAMGIGRFAFTPLLPAMLREGWVNIHGGGALASLNYAGYFVGALSCMALRVHPARMIRLGLALTVLTTLGMGLLPGYATWAVLRTAAGVASAWVMVFSSGWCLRRLAELHWPALDGVVFTGPGVGIALTGLAVGAAADHGLGAQAGWIGFALLGTVLCGMIWRVFGPDTAAPQATPHATASGRRPAGDVTAITLAYGLAGFGYIITATFLPVIARQALPGSPWPDLFWPLLGAAVVAGSLLATRVPQTWDNRLLLAGCYIMQAAGIVVGIVWPSVAGFALGSLLIGLPFTAIVLFVVREARRLRGEGANALIGLFTASYGIGQIAGPLVAAPLAAKSGSFTSSLLCAVGVLLAGLAIYLALWQRDRRAAQAAAPRPERPLR